MSSESIHPTRGYRQLIKSSIRGAEWLLSCKAVVMTPALVAQGRVSAACAQGAM
ncbi:MAG TPA: hypothetical protein VLC92_08260 [Rhodocyclaceae bacterium]|nr:hypothetical protein [Rhodocyclaceae bacterium]